MGRGQRKKKKRGSRSRGVKWFDGKGWRRSGGGQEAPCHGSHGKSEISPQRWGRRCGGGDAGAGIGG